MLDKLNGWIGQLTELGIGLLALAILVGLLVGTKGMENFNVVKNLQDMVTGLGSGGLAGLISLGVVLWLFNRK